MTIDVEAVVSGHNNTLQGALLENVTVAVPRHTMGDILTLPPKTGKYSLLVGSPGLDMTMEEGI